MTEADPDRGEKTFVVFRGPWWGIRAMAVILQTYQKKYGLKTIRQIIDRWAPPSDNNPTSDYVAFCANACGVDPDLNYPLENYSNMRRLIGAIVRFENGSDPYSWEYEVGLSLAGIEPPIPEYGST